MLKNACDYEESIVKFLKSGVANDELAAHLTTCADCQKTQRVVSFFQSNLKNEPSPKRLPAAGLIFWKARLRDKQRAAEQVSRPIFVAQVVAAIILGGVFVWLSGSDNALLSSLGSSFSRIADSLTQFVFPMLIGIVGFALVSFFTVLLMRRLLPEN